MTPSSPPPHQRAASHSPDTWFYCFLIFFFCYYFKRVCAFCGFFFFFPRVCRSAGSFGMSGYSGWPSEEGEPGVPRDAPAAAAEPGTAGRWVGAEDRPTPPPPTHTPRNCPFPKSFALSSVFRGHDIAGCVGKSHLRFESSLRRVSACCSARRGVG